MHCLKRTFIRPILPYLAIVACLLVLASCAKDEGRAEETVKVDNPTIDKLDTYVKQLTSLRDTSSYGFLTGMYPEESKSILTDAISRANKYILLLKYGGNAPGEDEINQCYAYLEASIHDFKTSARTEDAEYPAELFVDGNKGGYIDFGYSDDYLKFGDQGSQAFTIELWVKIHEYCNTPGEDNSTFLSTFVDGGSYFTGWRVQSRTRNILRGSVGIVDVNNNDRILWEPALPYGNTDEWVHFVFVYSDKGLDGDTDNRAKIYRNGVQTGDIIRIGEKERQYNAAPGLAGRIKMTGFTRTDLNGNRLEYFSGSMKYVRIWKSARTPAEIMSSFNGNHDVDPDDPNLVGAWDFNLTPKGGDEEIKDITGRHTAKLIGPYHWEAAQ